MIGLSDDQKVRPLVRNYDDLDVYKAAFAISLDIHKRSLEFPKIEQYALADQARRASKSICANIAEGYAKQQNSKAEFKRFLLIALGSSHEMQVWSEYCMELGYISAQDAEHWKLEYQKIARMLQKFINNM